MIVDEDAHFVHRNHSYVIFRMRTRKAQFCILYFDDDDDDDGGGGGDDHDDNDHDVVVAATDDDHHYCINTAPFRCEVLPSRLVRGVAVVDTYWLGWETAGHLLERADWIKTKSSYRRDCR